MEGTGRAHGRCAASVDGQKRMECGGWLAARNRPEQSQEGETWRSRQLWRWAACSSPLAPLPGYAWLPACRISVWLHRICLKRADKGPRQQSAVPVNPWLRSPDVDRLHPAAGHAVGQPVPKHGANQRPEMRDTPATLAACLVAWAASNNISRLPITHKTHNCESSRAALSSRAPHHCFWISHRTRRRPGTSGFRLDKPSRSRRSRHAPEVHTWRCVPLLASPNRCHA